MTRTRIVKLFAQLFVPLIIAFTLACTCTSAYAQYTYTPGYGTSDITANCTGTTNCWNLATDTSTPVTGALGRDGTNLWVNANGTLKTWNVSTRAWSTPSTSDAYTREIAMVDAGTIYRLKSTDPSCGTGPTWRTQKYDWHSHAWVNLTAGTDCQMHLAAGTDGTLMALGYGNANGAPVYKWNGTSWTVFGSVQVLTLSVADNNDMCAVSKVSGPKVYTLNTGVLVAMSVQPPGTPYACTIGAAAGGTYTLIAVNTLGVPYLYNWTSSTWTQIAGLTVSTPAQVGIDSAPPTLVNRSKGTLWAIGSVSGTYHWNNLTRYMSMTDKGSWTGCPIQACPPTGVTHTTSVQVHLPNGLSGQQQFTTQAPTVNINLTSTDFSSTCDPFTSLPGAPDCTPTDNGDNFCNFSNSDLGAEPPYTGCFLEGFDGTGLWPFGSNVTVYFDSQIFPATTCHAGDIGAACHVYTGISSWANKTPHNTSYTYGGVVQLTGQCYFTGPDGDINYPCGGHFPLMMVYSSGQPGYSFAGHIVSSPNGAAGSVAIAPDIVDVTANEQQSTGGHEEGHHHGLANCDASGTLCLHLTDGQTIMWYAVDNNSAITPTPCDIAWAIFWEGYY